MKAGESLVSTRAGHRYWWVLLFLVAGLLLVYHRRVFTGLRLIEADPYDTRFNNYILEHDYLWALGVNGHSALWSPPFFYPVPNTAAYSDILLSLVPFYAPLRLLGLPPDTAMQLLGLLFAAFNYGVSYLFLRRCSGAGVLACSAGAFLFSFASIRTVQLGHLQLIPHFFTLGALFALVRIFEGDGRDQDTRRGRWVWVLGACLVAQLYAGFYLAWFLGLGLLTAMVWALVLPSWRRCFLGRLRRLWMSLIGAGAASAVATLPLVVHYSEAARVLGPRDFQAVRQMLPRPQSWFNHGPFSWLYAWTQELGPIERMPFEWEQRLGLGIVTGALVIYGLWRLRQRAAVQVLLVTTATVLLLVMRWPGGFSLWQPIYDHVPGASAIRALGRIGLMVLIPAAVGFAAAWDDLRHRRPHLLLPVLGLLAILEQGQTLVAYPKQPIRRAIQVIEERIPADCEVFYYSPIRETATKAHANALGGQLNAMWAGLSVGIPTINGYSGNFPPGWQLFDHAIDRPLKEADLRGLFEDWLAKKQVRERKVCWVKIEQTPTASYTVEMVSVP